MNSTGVYGGYNHMAVNPGSNTGKKLIGRCAYAPTYCPEYPHCLDWYEDGSYDCNYCCVAYDHSNSRQNNIAFDNQAPGYITRSIQYYRDLQINDPHALVPLVNKLTQGQKVPLPCTNDPNIPCDFLGVSKYPSSNFIDIIDQLKGCEKLWSIFFFKPGSLPGGPYVMIPYYINSIIQNDVGNVLGINVYDSNSPVPYNLSIITLQRNGIKAVQC